MNIDAPFYWVIFTEFVNYVWFRVLYSWTLVFVYSVVFILVYWTEICVPFESSHHYKNKLLLVLFCEGQVLTGLDTARTWLKALHEPQSHNQAETHIPLLTATLKWQHNVEGGTQAYTSVCQLVDVIDELYLCWFTWSRINIWKVDKRGTTIN